MQTLGTDPLLSDSFYSSCNDQHSSGLKSITSQINSLLNTHKTVSYEFLLKNIINHNKSTLKRRVYDVLTVLRALGICSKHKKNFTINDFSIKNPSIIDSSSTLAARKRILLKKETLKSLMDIKDALLFVVERNSGLLANEKLYSPFVIVTTDKQTQVNCETNEESTFYRLCSKAPLNVMDDLTVFQEIHKKLGRENIENSTFVYTDCTFDSYLT